MGIPLRYREIFERAVSIIRSRLGDNLEITDLAASLFCTPHQLRRIFRAVTGHGVKPHINKIRMDLAMELLKESSLTIGEIAARTGFEDPSAFSRLFHSLTGATPSAFRASVTDTSDAATKTGPDSDIPRNKLLIRNGFPGTSSHACWKLTSGSFTGDGSSISLAPDDHWRLHLDRDLPDNFSMDIEISDMDHGYVCVIISGSADTSPQFCKLTVNSRIPAHIKVRAQQRVAIPEIAVSPGSSVKLRLLLRDNVLTLMTDGRTVFKHTDLFPPEIEERTRLTLFSPNAHATLSGFKLFKLETPPVVPAIRQGDILFAHRLYSGAAAVYRQQLESGSVYGSELRYKIALCLLKLRDRRSLDLQITRNLKIETDPAWKRENGLLRLTAITSPSESGRFIRLATAMMKNSEECDSLIPAIARYHRNVIEAGFYQAAIAIFELRDRIHGQSPVDREILHEKASHFLKNTGRYSRAEAILKAIVAHPVAHETHLSALISLADIATLQGRNARAESWIKSAGLLASKSGRRDIAMVDCVDAERLRSTGNFEGATLRFDGIASKYQSMPDIVDYASFRAMELALLSGRDKIHRRLPPGFVDTIPHPQKGSSPAQISAWLCANMMRRNYKLTAAYFSEVASFAGTRLFDAAGASCKAAIMLELSGDADNALERYRLTSSEYSADRCRYWGDLATSLARAEIPPVVPTTLFYKTVSEISFLLALLCGARNLPAERNRFLLTSVKCDPTRGWPSVLAAALLQHEHP